MPSLLEEGPRLVEGDFSRGMFPSLAPERIPPGGAFDISNGLLDEDNVVYRRGGTSYFSFGPLGSSINLLWSGYLKNGGQTIIAATKNNLVSVRSDGGQTLLGTGPAPAKPARGVAYEGHFYFPNGATWDGAAVGSSTLLAPYYATAAGRLLAGKGSRIDASDVPKAEGELPLTWKGDNFFSLPGGVQITGMIGLRTSCVVFTTEGIFVIGNLDRDLTDEAGNIQERMDLYAAQAVLWGDAGVAGWQGGLVVPCKDNVYLMQLGVSSERQAFTPITHDGVRGLYRGYVAAGYQPGVAGVHRGHYFLPILSADGESTIDTLVCRLDATGRRGGATYPWSRVVGYGGRLSAFVSTDQESSFLGATAGEGRLLTLSYFKPSAQSTIDADGSAIAFSLTTRDIETGNLVRNLVVKARLSYRMVAPPESTLVLSFGSTVAGGAEWGEFNWGEANWTSATGPFEELSAAGGAAKADPDGLIPKTWRVRRRVRYARVKVDLSGTATTLSIRALEMFVRLSGRI